MLLDFISQPEEHVGKWILVEYRTNQSATVADDRCWSMTINDEEWLLLIDNDYGVGVIDRWQ